MDKDILKWDNSVEKHNEIFVDTNIYKLTYDNLPNIDKIIDITQKISDYYGVPIDGDKMVELNLELSKKVRENEKTIVDKIKDKLGIDVSYINFTGRNKTDNHIANLCIKYLGLNSNYFDNENDDSKYSFKKSDLERLIKITKQNTPNETDKIQFLELIYEQIELTRLVSSFGQFYDSKLEYERKILTMWNQNLEPGHYEKDFKVVKNKLRDPNLFLAFPTYKKLDTCRISTSKPNIQGVSKELKELITAPKGYKIASMDISGQDVHILIWGILENQEIKNKYLETGDPYRAILEVSGYEYNEQLRKDTKVVILGVMNGMSIGTVLSDVSDKELGRKIYDLITRDIGYETKVNNYAKANKSKPKPKRMGLFGTKTNVGKDFRYKSSLENQLKNGFFQITAAEIVALSLEGFYREIEDNPDVTFNDIRLIVPIYDEFVILYREDLEEYALQIIEKYFKPVVEDWMKFMGKINYGYSYQAK